MKSKIHAALLGSCILISLCSIALTWSSTNESAKNAAYLEQTKQEVAQLRARLDAIKKDANIPRQRLTRVQVIQTPEERAKDDAGLPTQQGLRPLEIPPRHRSVQPTPSSPSVLDPEVEPEVRQKIQGMVRDQIAIEREERRERRRKRMQDRVKRSVEEFAKEVGLDQDTTNLMANKLVKEREQGRQQWRQVRRGELDPKDALKSLRMTREATEDEISTMLDEEQMEVFKEKRQQEIKRIEARMNR